MKTIRFLFVFAVLLPAFAAWGQRASVEKGDIVILYENDVHGAIEGYPLMAALRDEMLSQTPYVAVVSCGDFMSGCTVGALSKGRYPIRMMNAVGYDFVVPGNHEFDFGVDTMLLRMRQLSAEVLCCNFARMSGDRLLPASAMRRYGDVTVAFVGVTTPESMTSSTPLFFRDTAGNWAYTFYAQRLDSVVQACVDDVRRRGADRVVLLAHIGDNEIPPLVAATNGIDVVLDGHFHSVIPHTILTNRDGGDVLWSSTGCKFSNIGRLVIPQRGKIWNELIPTSKMNAAKNAVRDTMMVVSRVFDSLGSSVVGRSETYMGRSAKGIFADSPMGNLFCDAYCALTGAEIALANSGGIRDDLREGVLTFGSIYATAPFDNRLCLTTMSGQSIVDALEMSCRRYPHSEGEFLQVAGLLFEIDTTVASSVVCDENGIFERVAGQRRVKHVRVWDADAGRFVPIRLDRRYRVAGCDYTLLLNGDGFRFVDIELIDSNICGYAEAIERYVRDYLGGRIERSYGAPKGRIVVL